MAVGPSPTVASVMLTDVKLSRAGASVGEIRALFEDDHVHCAVVVHDGLLLSVIDRDDVGGPAASDAPAVTVGTLAGRVVAADQPLDDAYARLGPTGRRRLAVVDPDGRFRGLLCLKRSRRGFCSDRDVHARRRDREPCVAQFPVGSDALSRV